MLEKKRNSTFSPLLAAGMLLCVGCGDNGLAEVSGTVKLDGQPLEGAFVSFVPTGNVGTTAAGKSDENGYFVMEFSEQESGVLPGEYMVKITTEDLVDDYGTIKKIPERVPVKYNQKSTLTCIVKETGTQDLVFDLESKGEIKESDIGDLDHDDG